MPGTPHITSAGLGQPDRAESGASSSAGSTLPRQTALQCSGKASPGNRTRNLRSSPKPKRTSSTTLPFKNFKYSLVTAQRGIHQEPDPAGCHHLPLDPNAATEGAWEALHGARRKCSWLPRVLRDGSILPTPPASGTFPTLHCQPYQILKALLPLVIFQESKINGNISVLSKTNEKKLNDSFWFC